MSTVRGQRYLPTNRTAELLALRNIQDAIAAGARRHRVEVPRGAILARPCTGGARLALLNRAGHRVAVGSASWSDSALDVARTLAEILCKAPVDTTGRPDVSPVAVGNVMQMRRNQRCPVQRADGTIRMGMPGAHAVIDPRRLVALADAGAWVRFTLEGAWTTAAAARVADAMLRDLAPAARHLTYTTEPRGWHLNGIFANKRGGGHYDGASTAYCSCGWFCMEGDRASARASAAWHRENPDSYRPA